MNRPRTLYFVTGILANLRLLIGEAIEVGERYGYRVRILDLIDLVPGWKPYPNPWQTLGLDQHVRRPIDQDAFDKFCAEEISAGDILLFLHLPEDEVLEIWRRLQRTPASVGMMTVNPVPIRHAEPSTAVAKLEAGVRRLLRPVKSLLKPTPDLWVISGQASVPSYISFFRDTRGTQFIYGHSMDYEYSRRYLDQPGSNRTILFLDQGWFSKLQSDYRADGRYPPTRYEVFQKAICRFLQELESQSGWKVVISSHPKAKLKDTRALYPDYEVSDASTAELVADAAVLIGNCSTSLQYGVIFNKPIILFSSDELDRSIMYPGVAGFHEALGAPIVNIDAEQDYPALLERLGVDEVRYGAFIRNYVDASGGDNRPLWDKVFSQLGQSSRAAA